MKLFLGLLLLLGTHQVLSNPAASRYGIPNEDRTCSSESEQYTQEMLNSVKDFDLGFVSDEDKEAEANSCIGCITESYSCGVLREIVNLLREFVQSASINEEMSKDPIPEICFYANMIYDSSPKKIFYCNNPSDLDKTKNTDGRKFCLNQDYVRLTAKAFNEIANCFDFNKQERDSMFFTLVHESRFILNKKSDGHAICYGQLLLPTLQMMNNYIYSRDYKTKKPNYHNTPSGKPSPLWHEYGQIYNKAIQKCPGLAEKVVPPKMSSEFGCECEDESIEQVPKDVCEKQRNCKYHETLSPSERDNVTKDSNIKCAIAHDPYSCLLYSMFYMKMARHSYGMNDLQTPLEYPNVPEQFISDFSGSNSNLMVTILEGPLRRRSDGDIKNIQYVMPDLYELKNFFLTKECQGDCYKYEYRKAQNSEKRDVETGELRIKPVPLFEENLLREFFSVSSHNGGTGVIVQHMKPFIRDLKRKIADGAECNQNKECKKYREKLLDGNSLDESVLIKEWKKYAENESNGVQNAKEVQCFYYKTKRDTRNIRRKNLSVQFNANSNLEGRVGNQTEFINKVERSCSPFINQAQIDDTISKLPSDFCSD